MKRDAIAILRPKKREISTQFAKLFGLRYLLDRYGYDPCDEWDIDLVLGLPDGLTYQNGEIQYQCRVCDRWTEWPVEISDFVIDDPHNVCGGSPRCCP